MTDTITVTIKYSAAIVRVSLDRDALVLKLKERLCSLSGLSKGEGVVDDIEIVEGELEDIPIAQQRLIYKGRVLKDELSLSQYEMQEDHFVHLVKSVQATSLAGQEERLAGDVTGTGADAPMSEEVRDILNQVETSSDLRRLHAQIIHSPALTQKIMNAPLSKSLLHCLPV